MQNLEKKKSFSTAEMRMFIANYKARQQQQDTIPLKPQTSDQRFQASRVTIEREPFTKDECVLHTKRILTQVRTKYHSKFKTQRPLSDLFILLLLEYLPKQLIERILQKELDLQECWEQIHIELLQYEYDQSSLTRFVHQANQAINSNAKPKPSRNMNDKRYRYRICPAIFHLYQEEITIVQQFQTQHLKLMKSSIKNGTTGSRYTSCTKVFVHFFFLHSAIFREIASKDPKYSFLFNDIHSVQGKYHTSQFTRVDLLELGQQMNVNRHTESYTGPINLLCQIFINGKQEQQSQLAQYNSISLDTGAVNCQANSTQKERIITILTDDSIQNNQISIVFDTNFDIKAQLISLEEEEDHFVCNLKINKMKNREEQGEDNGLNKLKYQKCLFHKNSTKKQLIQNIQNILKKKIRQNEDQLQLKNMNTLDKLQSFRLLHLDGNLINSLKQNMNIAGSQEFENHQSNENQQYAIEIPRQSQQSAIIYNSIEEINYDQPAIYEQPHPIMNQSGEHSQNVFALDDAK